ncbi:MAG: hypothetical protein HWE34_04310 [Methylocystaceae bacterium]|nr:hypothetical protein [Methylocystaceae bacterium]
MTGMLLPYLQKAVLHHDFKSLEEQAEIAEAWETAPWAVRSILRVELLTPSVVDPCCGTGIITDILRKSGYSVHSQDLYDWGFEGADKVGSNWLIEDMDLTGRTVMMNPPFSLACKFVDKAFALGARKVLCFQRQAWRESQERRMWWEKRPPARIWLCGDRANTWLFTLPPDQRKNPRMMPCAWYVWEEGHRGIEASNTIWKKGLAA